MDTHLSVIGWLALSTAMVGLVWLYGASWRAVAKALTESRTETDTPATGAHLDGDVQPSPDRRTRGRRETPAPQHHDGGSRDVRGRSARRDVRALRPST